MNRFIRGFANKPHLDMNDVCDAELRKAGKLIIEDVESEIDKYELHDDPLNTALKHIKKMVGTECGQSTLTTCGYNMTLAGVNQKTAHGYFIFNDLDVAVEIPTNCGYYHTFSGTFGFHQTAIPVTFDGKYVNLNDEDLMVFAWGAGKSDKRVYHEDNGVHFEDGEHFRQMRMEEFYVHVANEEQCDHIRAMGWINE